MIRPVIENDKWLKKYIQEVEEVTRIKETSFILQEALEEGIEI